MHQSGETARLTINGKSVGQVVVRNFADSWGFGDFQPNSAFAEFATLFGKWSLLMHADDGEQLSPAASEELRRVELALDSLRAQLVFDLHRETINLRQINIDGHLIEWKVGHKTTAKRAG